MWARTSRIHPGEGLSIVPFTAYQHTVPQILSQAVARVCMVELIWPILYSTPAWLDDEIPPKRREKKGKKMEFVS